MAQHTILLSIDDVRVHQAGSILFPKTTLNIQLRDIPSNALTSIPKNSEPPSYNDLVHSTSTEKQKQLSLHTCLVVSLADGLIDIPLSQSSKISCPSPRSYLIPISPAHPSEDDLQDKAQSPAIINLEIAHHIDHETVETLDSIFTSWSHFEGPPSPTTDLSLKKTPFNSLSPPPPSHPSTSSSSSSLIPPQHSGPSQPSFPPGGRLALMDESTGEICGELDSDVKAQSISPHTPPYPPGPSNLAGQQWAHQPLLGAPQPVIVSLSSSSPNSAYPMAAEVAPVPVNGQSQILEGAEWVSRGILAGSEVISGLIAKSGMTYLASSKPVAEPITFSSSTHSSVDRVLGFTRSASKVSGKTAAIVGSFVGKVGDSIGKSTGIQRSPSGALPTGTRGYVHKGLVAANTVLSSLETGAKKVLTTAGDTTTNVVRHAYGEEAGHIAARSNDAIRNVALVYIDARGVTRRAILKSVGKAAIKGRMSDGREVIFASDEKLDHWIALDASTPPPPQSGSKPRPA